MHRLLQILILTVVLALAGSGCSIRRIAANRIGDALAGSGATFASDDDPELVKDASAFSLKLMESVLAESPRHRGLLTAAASGFAQYSFAFVQLEADEIEAKDFAAAEALRARAKRLYLRARDYGLRGLEISHPGLSQRLRAEPARSLAQTRPGDVGLLYWTAVAWGAAISLGKDDPALIAQLPQVEALIDRAATLDVDWGEGAIHNFLVQFEMSRQTDAAHRVARARRHFERALELTRGQQAGPWVAYAEAIAVEQQQAKEFDAALQRALAVDVNARPEWRLVNLVMQRRARWLLAKKDDLFLNAGK